MNMNLDLAKLLDSKIADKDDSHRRTNFHVTDLSKCLRGVIIARKDPSLVSFDERTNRIFKCGNLFEDYVVSSIPEDRIIATQEMVKWDELGLVGFCDLIVKDDAGNPLLLELKSQNSRSFHWNKLRGGASEQHVQQVSLYHSKLKDKYQGLQMGIVYVSKDDLCLDSYTIQENTELVKDALSNAAVLAEHWKAGTLPEAEQAVVFDELAKKWTVNWKAKYCSVHHLCTGNLNWLEEAEALVAIKNKELKKK